MDKTIHQPKHQIRFVTAASLFDGHDASINIMRRLLQSAGVEVVHLGHNRSVAEIVDAAIQEDVQGIAVSSYQGGHVEFFKYMIDLLRERGAAHIQVFGGGGGTIVASEIDELQRYGVRRIYSPEDGRHLGLTGIIDDMVRRTDFPTVKSDEVAALARAPLSRDPAALAKRITAAEMNGDRPAPVQAQLLQDYAERAKCSKSVVVGVTGTGGAGKSSFTDELVCRYLREEPEGTVAVLSVDPSKRKTGGALLGDRIRMNSADSPRVFMRSLATRGSSSELSDSIDESVALARAAGFDLVFVETSGIGQGASGIIGKVDLSIYVMTPEYGAPTQLEKIDMIDFADVIVVNKFDRGNAEDALRDVRKQFRRSRQIAPDAPNESLPVFGAISAQYNDEGVNAVYRYVRRLAQQRVAGGEKALPAGGAPTTLHRVIPPPRARYLGEIAEGIRAHKTWIAEQSECARRIESLETAHEIATSSTESAAAAALERLAAAERRTLDPGVGQALAEWRQTAALYAQDELVTRVRDRELRTKLRTPTLSGTKLGRVALPRFAGRADLVRWLYSENLPGFFPYTAGVFNFKRDDEDPARQFAGEGPPARTNARFHLLCDGAKAKRLSTAFDSVTLYGHDPDERPDIYGKVGESGVSICTLRDMERLYAGFDLVDPNTSVSMTINGPAPMILAMFLNTAIDQNLARFARQKGRAASESEHGEIAARVLTQVRGTVQADILKEDQAQNTCIFSTEFALRMMGDVQQYFIDKGVRNYYSVSISGYHIAEAGANPISQLAFTLANGFTYVEYYLARGMKIDDFAPSFSFFFSNGLDAEYSVLGRVARRIWARAIRFKYGGNERSQKLKYHIQTSGRSLHAQEVQFNDIRTTLQALIATYDNCNSLHTNAYDEAITTPTEESVRRALAIQLIISREYGLAKNDNPLQGSYVVEELTDLVEEAVLAEFEALDRRGGVIGAMEAQYQRSKIQDESMLYERLKHSGELPIVGVNTFLKQQDGGTQIPRLDLTRATKDEKDGQIAALRAFQHENAAATPGALARLREVALSGGNIFAELMSTVRVASLGQITQALYEVGGRYRRNV
jgi:isobutyryl-CoA mutase